LRSISSIVSVVLGKLVGYPIGADPGIVEQKIDPPEPCHRGVHRGGHGSVVTDVPNYMTCECHIVDEGGAKRGIVVVDDIDR
jgi:hypothetical protein